MSHDTTPPKPPRHKMYEVKNLSYHLLIEWALNGSRIPIDVYNEARSRLQQVVTTNIEEGMGVHIGLAAMFDPPPTSDLGERANAMLSELITFMEDAEKQYLRADPKG